MPVSKQALTQNYAEWLGLIDHLVAFFGKQWPEGQLKPQVSYDEVVVFWTYGQVGRIYRSRGRVCFSSDARVQLRELNADVEGLEFHERLLPIDGWISDEGVRSDIEYAAQHFWETALEEAKLHWDGMMAATKALDQ